MQDKEPNCEKERERENERERDIEQRHRKKTIEINITTQYRQTLAVLAVFFMSKAEIPLQVYTDMCSKVSQERNGMCA